MKIVVSSSWRVFHPIEELREILQARLDIPSELIIDYTPRLPYGLDGRSSERGDEIQAWLDSNTKVPDGSPLMPRYAVEDFIIIDDDSDMAHLKTTNFLQTDYILGLTLHDANKIIKRFKSDCGGWE